MKGVSYMNYHDDRFVAGGGTLSLATIGTVLGGASLLGNGNGLGGLFGGGNLQKENAALLAKVGSLESEKYSDANDAKVYDAIRVLERKQGELETSVICLQKELTAYAAGQKEVQELRQQLTDCKINGVSKDLNCLAEKVETGFCGINKRFGGIDAAIASFTQTVIPQRVICDTSDCGGGTQ